MYIVVSKIKKKIKAKGFRVSKCYLTRLDAAIENIIDYSLEWVKPKKTAKGEDLQGYLSNWHNFK